MHEEHKPLQSASGDDAVQPVVERRQRRQKRWRRLLRWLSICGWLLMAAALGLFHEARPELHFGLLRYHGIEVRGYWRADMTHWLLLVLWSNCALSVLAIVVNGIRMRRKEDNRYYNLLLLGAVSLVFILLLRGVEVN